MIAFPALLLIAGVVLFFCIASGKHGKVNHVTGQIKTEHPWSNFSKPEASTLHLDRYRNDFEESYSDVTNHSGSKLALRIQKCAATVLKAVLPEKAELLVPLEVTLLDEYSALVSCRAVIFATATASERRLKCKIKVNYLADGSCEAEYPEFFSDK